MLSFFCCEQNILGCANHFFLSLFIVYTASQLYLGYTCFPDQTYHSAATLHVVEVPVSVGAEVHTSSNPRERPTLLDPQTTIWCSVFMLHL